MAHARDRGHPAGTLGSGRDGRRPLPAGAPSSTVVLRRHAKSYDVDRHHGRSGGIYRDPHVSGRPIRPDQPRFGYHRDRLGRGGHRSRHRLRRDRARHATADRAGASGAVRRLARDRPPCNRASAGTGEGRHRPRTRHVHGVAETLVTRMGVMAPPARRLGGRSLLANAAIVSRRALDA